MSNMPLSVVILAAGQGTRMKSDLPKVLQPLGGRPLVEHVVRRAGDLGAAKTYVVYGHGGAAVPRTLEHLHVEWVEQAEQLGTGHAVEQAVPGIPGEHTVLILYGDVPLIREATLRRLVDEATRDKLAVLTVRIPNPTGYGRIVRNPAGQVIKIVEQKDANAEEIKINEVNTGLLACRADKLKNWLQRLNNDNAQGEYYLTDVIAMAAEENYCVEAVIADTIAEVHGVNDRKQLAEAEAHLRKEKAEELMSSGVTLLDPARIDVRGKLECGKDVIIDVNVIFEGEVHLGDRVRIGANAIVKNAVIGADTEVLSHSLIDNAEIGKRCRVGPFARIRPDTALSDDVHIGNFVELKKSTVAENSKINHLSYVGDSKIGKGVNIGAGTITCNYDGVNKYQTVIGDDAFIGSNTSLVAPVKIGDGATVGAGSTIAKDVSDGKLAISRARQATVPNWKRPEKK